MRQREELHYIDVDKLPEGCKESVTVIATKWNAFLTEDSTRSLDMEIDLDGISGASREEKGRAWGMFKMLRDAHAFISGHKLNITTSIMWAALGLLILRLLGVPTGLLYPVIFGMIKMLLHNLA